MARALPIVIAVALAIYALFDLIATPSWRVRFLPKPLWFIAIIPPIIGPLVWIFFGSYSEPAPTPPADRPPGPRGPKRDGPIGPDDDPDFLRGL